LSNKYKICIVIPYFGKWPEWINYFLLSCKYNITIDWQFFTDCGLAEVSSKNLTFHHTTLTEFNELASTQLNLEISIQNPYKLCDLKPAYGLIFQKYLINFDFWGYGDIDLIYGNIETFITNQLLDTYDIISNNKDFVAGHFCILRNTLVINQLFMKGGLYKKAFLESKYTGFDEQILDLKISTNPRHLKLSKRINTVYHLGLNYIVKSPIKLIIRPIWIMLRNKDNHQLKDFTSIVSAMQNNNKIKVHFSTTFQSDLMLLKRKIKKWQIRWDNGSLRNSQTGNEILYFHFILSKTSGKFRTEPFNNNTQNFYIQPSGIKTNT